MKRLVIDDLRIFTFEAEYARTLEEGLRLIDNSWREVWLDHDLGGDDTIYPVVLKLTEAAFYGSPYNIDWIYIHTDNPVGRENITKSLEKYYNVGQVYVDSSILKGILEK